MKILLYSDSFFPTVGGIETITLELARGLAEWKPRDESEKGFEVTVVTQTEGSIPDDGKLGFRIVRRPGVWNLLTLIRECQLVHLAGPAVLPLLLGCLAHKPVVVEHHGFQAVCPNGQLFHTSEKRLCVGNYVKGRYNLCFQCNLSERSRLKSAKLLALTPLRRWLCNRAAFNVVPTEWLGNILQLARTKTIFHGVAPSHNLNHQNGSPPMFAFQGRLVSTKGVGVLLDAVKKLRAEQLDFSIKIVGDGPERTRLEAQARSLRDCVEFVGSVPGPRLQEILSNVCAIVVPSLAGEVFGLVAAENMLRSKLLIVSDLGALQEIVGETAIVTRAGDVEDLAAAMRNVIQDKSLSSSLGSKARARALEYFNVSAMIESHVSVYRDAAASRG